MAAVIQSSLLDEDEEARDCGMHMMSLHGRLGRSEVTALGGKAVEVMGDHGVNGPVLSPRGMFLKQMVGWVGKVGGNFTCLFYPLWCPEAP